MKSFKKEIKKCFVTISTVLVPTLVYCQSNNIVINKSELIPEVKTTYDKTYTNYLVAQDHVDLCWYFDWQKAVNDIINTADRQLELLRNNPDFKFMFPQSQVYRWLQEYRPDIFNQIKIYIDAGRWEVAGGQLCEPDNTLPSGETAARNFLIGKRYARQELGIDVKIAYLPDSFGHIWTYPQILALSGIYFFVETKLDVNTIIKVPFLCNWKSPEGTSILTCNTFIYGHYADTPYNYPDSPDYMNRTMAKAVSSGLNKSLRTFGGGDNSGGPHQSDLESIRRLDTADGNPHALFSTFNDYYHAIKPDLRITSLPTFNDELYLDSRRGVWTCGAAEKYYRRKNDVKVEEAEKFATIATWLGSADYPVEKLKMTWEYICLLTNHDHSNGTWCNNTAYNRTLRTFGITTNLIDMTLDYACNAIASRASTDVGKGNVPVVVFNPLSWIRNDVVETQVVFDRAVVSIRVYNEVGMEVPSQIKTLNGKTATIVFEADSIPGTGFKVYKVTPATNAVSYKTGLKIGGNEIENDFIKAKLNRSTGNFSNVKLKANSWEAIKPGTEANELQLFTDNANSRDLKQEEMEATPILINNISNLKVVESGPVRVIYSFNKSTPSGATPGSSIVQSIIMYSNLDRIDIKTDVKWDEKFKFLKVSFPLNVSPDSCTFEIPFGNISRSVTRNTPETAAKFEVYGHKWADMSKDGFGVSILNDSKYGWDAKNNRLRLSLYKASNDKDTRFEKGTYTTTYSIYPHAGDWKNARTVQKANEINYPVIAKQEPQHAGNLGKEYSFVNIDQTNVMITAIKKAEDKADDLIIRLVEINGKSSTNCKVAFSGAIKEALSVNLIEDILETANFSGNVLYTNLHQYEIKSFRVSITNPSYLNTKPELTKVDLSASYNLDGISTNDSRIDGDLDGKGYTFSAELMPQKISSEDVEFSIGGTGKKTRNIVQCSGQRIKIPAGNYSSLQILAIAAGGSANESGIFSVDYYGGEKSSIIFSIRDWIAEFYALKDDFTDWNAPIKENIAYIFTHRHFSTSDDTCRTTYLFKYNIDLNKSKIATALLLPKNDKIKILAMTLINAPITSTRQKPNNALTK
jgi:alpha-mannosidase